MTKQIRSAMCTIHYNGDPYEAVPDWEKLTFVKRAMGQLEIGEKTNKKHWQIFVECKYPIDPKRLQGLGMHVDTKNTHKHPKAGRAYVRKHTPFVNSRFDWPEEASVFQTIKDQRKERKAYEKLGEQLIEGKDKLGFFVNKEILKKMLKMNIDSCIKKCSEASSTETGA